MEHHRWFARLLGLLLLVDLDRISLPTRVEIIGRKIRSNVKYLVSLAALPGILMCAPSAPQPLDARSTPLHHPRQMGYELRTVAFETPSPAYVAARGRRLEYLREKAAWDSLPKPRGRPPVEGGGRGRGRGRGRGDGRPPAPPEVPEPAFEAGPLITLNVDGDVGQLVLGAFSQELLGVAQAWDLVPGEEQAAGRVAPDPGPSLPRTALSAATLTQRCQLPFAGRLQYFNLNSTPLQYTVFAEELVRCAMCELPWQMDGGWTHASHVQQSMMSPELQLP